LFSLKTNDIVWEYSRKVYELPDFKAISWYFRGLDMCMYIGIENLAANAFIELFKHN